MRLSSSSSSSRKGTTREKGDGMSGRMMCTFFLIGIAGALLLSEIEHFESPFLNSITWDKKNGESNLHRHALTTFESTSLPDNMNASNKMKIDQRTANTGTTSIESTISDFFLSLRQKPHVTNFVGEESAQSPSPTTENTSSVDQVFPRAESSGHAPIVNESALHNQVTLLADKNSTKEGVQASDCIPIRPLLWEWNYFSNNTNEKVQLGLAPKNGTMESISEPQHVPGKKLLIGLYSGFDKYARMLEVTAPVNKAYAKLWGHDLVVLQGTYLILPNERKDDCTPNGRRVTFNKIALLDYAINHNQTYDQLLLLDTDAMMYDLSFDITTLLPDEYMLAGHRVKLKDVKHTWDVNAGVTLWNLHHEQTPLVAKTWLEYSTKVLVNESPTKGDQRELHLALQDTESKNVVVSYEHEFEYGHGTRIRHYIRKAAHKGWTDPNILENRLDRLVQQSSEVCGSQPPQVCKQIEFVAYTHDDSSVSNDTIKATTV